VKVAWHETPGKLWQNRSRPGGVTSGQTPCHRRSEDDGPWELLAVYGTLRRRSIFHKLPVAAGRLKFFSCGVIGGRLFWQRTYPALIQDRGIAQVELFRIVDPNVLDDLDRYEGFDSSNLRASLFVRTQVLLLNPQLPAWAYFLNLQIPRGTQRERENAE
jgi:gamma-glutamylcyclotransferase (GGCT)/AIG2-like uncharacterized protein YtfP